MTSRIMPVIPSIAKIVFKERCEDSQESATYVLPDDPNEEPIFYGYMESDKSFKRRILEANNAK